MDINGKVLLCPMLRDIWKGIVLNVTRLHWHVVLRVVVICVCGIFCLYRNRTWIVWPVASSQHPNNAFHQYNTRDNKNLHLPSIHLMKYAKGPYVNGIKVFNRLPQTIKNLEHSPVKFKNFFEIFFPSAPLLFTQGIFRTWEFYNWIIWTKGSFDLTCFELILL
jgi:hypothetical protein